MSPEWRVAALVHVPALCGGVQYASLVSLLQYEPGGLYNARSTCEHKLRGSSGSQHKCEPVLKLEPAERWTIPRCALQVQTGRRAANTKISSHEGGAAAELGSDLFFGREGCARARGLHERARSGFRARLFERVRPARGVVPPSSLSTALVAPEPVPSYSHKTVDPPASDPVRSASNSPTRRSPSDTPHVLSKPSLSPRGHGHNNASEQSESARAHPAVLGSSRCESQFAD